MPKPIRIYSDIDQEHESKFLFLKGFYGAKNNGDCLEAVIDLAFPIVKDKLLQSAQGAQETN